MQPRYSLYPKVTLLQRHASLATMDETLDIYSPKKLRRGIASSY